MSETEPRTQRLAIFAGAGELPYLAALSAAERKLNFVVYHIAEAELFPQLKLDQSFPLREVSLGDIAKTFAFLKGDKITDVVLLGKIEKQRMLQDVKRDAAAEQIYNAAPDRRDDTLFLQFAAALTQMGIRILNQKELLPSCFLSPGVHTKRQPEDKTLNDDIEFGYALSRKIGSLDIGQTAVVFQKMILAVEAIEGTDAAIMRAGEIARKQGGVVCKTAKAAQDMRFDLPAVGIRTLETMRAAGMQALVFEAAHTLVVHPAEFTRKADELGLIVIAK